TRFSRDWSSDVCSSDLDRNPILGDRFAGQVDPTFLALGRDDGQLRIEGTPFLHGLVDQHGDGVAAVPGLVKFEGRVDIGTEGWRLEERRVGKKITSKSL